MEKEKKNELLQEPPSHSQQRLEKVKRSTRSVMNCRLKIWQILALVLVLGCLFFAFAIYRDMHRQTHKEVLTSTTISEIVCVNELSTLQFSYRGVAEQPNAEKPEKIDYYVSYDAEVRAGIDLDQIDTAVDQEQHQITVTLPEVKFTDISVDIASLDYIFMNNKANTETVSAQAYALCQEDIDREVQQQSKIHTMAMENAQQFVRALITPFLEQDDVQYTLNLEWREQK